MSTELISINPTTNTVIHRFSTHSDQELDHFATEASKSQKQWRKSSLEDRRWDFRRTYFVGNKLCDWEE